MLDRNRPSLGQNTRPRRQMRPKVPAQIDLSCLHGRLLDDSTRREVRTRRTSAESFNQIRVVDDKSIGSVSGDNNESEKKKGRPIKSKTKDVQTSTDPAAETKQHSKGRRHSLSRTRSRDVSLDAPKHERDRSSDKSRKPVNGYGAPVLKKLLDDHHSKSDSEPNSTEKPKKRRRPKRISRTSQTYEAVFRRMEQDRTRELRATNDQDKSIQTRKSQLRPRGNSPKKQYPFYVSPEGFK